MRFLLTPSFAYVNANNGNDISYGGDRANSRLPHISRTGFSLYAAGKTDRLTLLSARFCIEMETNLVGREETINKFGYEIGFGETFYLREGQVRYPWHQWLTTHGFGFSLKGVIAFLYEYQNMRIRSHFWDDIIRHLDFSFDYAKYSNASSSTLASTSFSGLSFSF